MVAIIKVTTDMHYSSRHQDVGACLQRPMVSSLVSGTLIASISGAQSGVFSSRLLLGSAAFVYIYNAIQCPLEALSNRRSYIHNGIAGAIIGTYGVQMGMLSVMNINHVNLPRSAVAALLYGGIGTIMGILEGKRF